jgi:eukaryotic-like serine/threonine-protein kinase
MAAFLTPGLSNAIPRADAFGPATPGHAESSGVAVLPQLSLATLQRSIIVSSSSSSGPRVLSDRYVLERTLGRGGMATVHLAEDLRHQRRVAVKILDAELAQSVSSERFLQEIRFAARLSHPHILPLHDSGSDSGVLYYVMPYIEGETLRSRLDRERQLPLDEAVRITCEIAGALDYAHRQQIVHRDIKPENILLEDGHAVVADFGIARALDASAGTGMTVTGVAIGTPSYMSPEQAIGESSVDARTDIYALGCVLYELLAGEPPFTGPTAHAVIAKRLADPPPRIRTVRPSVPPALEKVLLQALDRVPADRFASAGDFQRALEAAAKQDPRASQVRGWTRPMLAAAAAVVLLVVTTAGWNMRHWLDRGSAVLTVAVLPLELSSTSPDYAYLADGLTDALIEDLSSAPGLRVISRMSAFRYAGVGGASGMAPMGGGMAFMDAGSAPADGMGMSASLEDAVRELGADVVLQGTLRLEGDSAHVSATLVRAPELLQVWEQSYTRHVRELSGLQRELAAAVVSAVAPRGRDRAVVASAPRVYHPDAEDAYAKGRYFQIHWKLPQAVAAFERAVEIDPTHAPAHAGLSRVWYFLAFFGDAPPSLVLAHMRRAATAALEQDSLMAEAHAQMALVKMLQEWDWEGAERHFRRALDLSPGHAQIRHDYAHFLLGQGRQGESARESRLAVELDPVNPMLISCLGWHSLFDAQYADAHRHALDANALMPDHWAYVVLGWSLLGLAQPEDAIAAFRAAHQLRQTGFTLAALGHALAVSGREAEARTTLAALLDRMEDEYVSPYDVATVYAGLGDADQTFRWLRRAAEERSTFIVHVAWDARFDRVRNDTRFADLTTREMRLPQPQFAALTAAERRAP